MTDGGRIGINVLGLMRLAASGWLGGSKAFDQVLGQPFVAEAKADSLQD